MNSAFQKELLARQLTGGAWTTKPIKDSRTRKPKGIRIFNSHGHQVAQFGVITGYGHGQKFSLKVDKYLDGNDVPILLAYLEANWETVKHYVNTYNTEEDQ